MTPEEIERRAALLAQEYGCKGPADDRRQVRRLAELVAALALRVTDLELLVDK